MLVQIALFDGFGVMDALAPYDVLCAGALATGGALRVEFATAEGAREVPSGPAGLKIAATARLDPERAKIILVPGAAGRTNGDGPDTIPALLGRALESGLAAILRRAMARPEVTVSTVCGGSMLLAMSGLLAGRNAVTNHLALDLLAHSGAKVIPARVVDDGDLVTSGGVTSGIDLGLYLLEREFGPRVAYAIEQLFEHERRGTTWRAQGLEPLPI